MRNHLITISVIIAMLGLVSGMTLPLFAAESADPTTCPTPVYGPNDPHSASAATATATSEPVVMLSATQPEVFGTSVEQAQSSTTVVGTPCKPPQTMICIPAGPDTAVMTSTSSNYKLEARPLSYIVSPFFWRVFAVKDVAGTTRIYLMELRDEYKDYIDYDDKKDQIKIAAVLDCFGIKHIEELKNQILTIDSDPELYFDVITATFSPKGQKLAKALAKALVNQEELLPKDVEMPDELSPIWGFDAIFLGQVSKEVSTDTNGKYCISLATPAERSEIIKRGYDPRLTTVLVVESKSSRQRVVIESGYRDLEWLDPRPMSEAEMANPGGIVTNENPSHANLEKACDIMMRQQPGR